MFSFLKKGLFIKSRIEINQEEKDCVYLTWFCYEALLI